MRPLRGPLAAAIVVVILAAIGVATGAKGSARSQPVAAARAVVADSSVLICPSVTGMGEQAETRLSIAAPQTPTGQRPLTLGELRGKPYKTHSVPSGNRLSAIVDKPGQAVSVSATGPTAALIGAAQVALIDNGPNRGLTATACPRPAADSWFVGADGRVGINDELFLSNPGATAASVAVTILSSDTHAVIAPSLAALTVPARQTVRVALAKVAPNVPDMAIRVHATEGLVSSALRDSRVAGTTPLGSDWLPIATPPAHSIVVPGLTGGAGDRRLVIGDPGSQTATVHLRLITASGSFAPNAQTSVDVAGGETASVNLTKALQAQAGAVVLTSNQPVVAGAIATTTEPQQLSDLLWRAGSAPLETGDLWAQAWTGEKRDEKLNFVAPTAAATVTLRDALGHSAMIPVGAGRAVAVDLKSALKTTGVGDGWVRVAAVTGGPVYGVQTIRQTGAHGPLIAGADPTRPVPPTRVPGVVAEPQLANQPSAGSS